MTSFGDKVSFLLPASSVKALKQTIRDRTLRDTSSVRLTKEDRMAHCK